MANIRFTLNISILVQLARDLGEDFYIKYWPRSVILLSQSINHHDVTVVEV
jgi:U3 small nucleolar RNA-associated protein 20